MSRPAMPLELSLNAMMLLAGFAASVDLTISISVSGSASPSITCRPRKKPCRECSEFALFRSMISTIVGLRPCLFTK